MTPMDSGHPLALPRSLGLALSWARFHTTATVLIVISGLTAYATVFAASRAIGSAAVASRPTVTTVGRWWETPPPWRSCLSVVPPGATVVVAASVCDAAGSAPLAVSATSMDCSQQRLAPAALIAGLLIIAVPALVSPSASTCDLHDARVRTLHVVRLKAGCGRNRLLSRKRPPKLAPVETVFGLVVKEGTNNISRHARASHVATRFEKRSLTIENDGAPDRRGDLMGLASLDERHTALGSRLRTRLADCSFSLRAGSR